MKYNLKITLFLVMSFGYFSCVDLELGPDTTFSIERLQTEGDVMVILAPVYRRMAEVYRYPHLHRMTTYGADDLTSWWASGRGSLRMFDRFSYGNGEHSDDSWLQRTWDGYWEVIYRANTVIEGLKKASAPLQIVTLADGEARFLRALAYFHLVRSHGNMPILLDGHFPTGKEQRATVLQNYWQIEHDLKLAENSLPHPAEVGLAGRASSAAAKTLLADLYLTWAGWPVKDKLKYGLAAAKAKEVIDMNYFELMPIEDLWLLSNQNSRESIFSIQFSEEEDFRSDYPATFSFHESRGWSNAYPELRFFYDFPEGPRKEATFATEIPQREVKQGKIVTKDPPTKPWQESGRKHPMYKKFTISENLTLWHRTSGYRAIEVFRYAEILLIYAEAQANLSENTGSIEAFNQVKRRAAGLPYLIPDAAVDVSTASPTDIIDERGWEFAGEHKRWFDLIRSERLEEIAAKRDPLEQVALSQQPTKDNYIAPIPFSAISSSNLIQNPNGFVIQ